MVFLSITIMVFGYVQIDQTDGWSFMAIPIFGGIGISALVLDYIIKAIIPVSIAKLWLTESLILAILLILYNLY